MESIFFRHAKWHSAASPIFHSKFCGVKKETERWEVERKKEGRSVSPPPYYQYHRQQYIICSTQTHTRRIQQNIQSKSMYSRETHHINTQHANIPHKHTRWYLENAHYASLQLWKYNHVTYEFT